ncbi:NAD(P)/FAD-dependent oxidoreductase [Winogradskyella alexanderae]|uniref:FAD-binding oxidoreductase n=1 Tax=Winogradskyella alexanderae TaxID=2877123 RepID=A0ABS7XU60_9FLAO|nr:FAD-binding oxidoreductase [Winogradskyella alexanderae]MCA0132968.1 FAD-binding oxidoreductase [Winogradskyella alexanderae]
MREVEYIVVGCGLASIAFCEKLRANNHSFIIYDDRSQQSSLVAAGLYNPVILKRFTEVWKAKEQLEIALPTYEKIEKDLQIKIDHKLKIYRRFASIEEQNIWFSATDKIALEPYLSTTIIKNSNQNVDAPYGYGEVLHAGRLDTETLITNYKSFMKVSNNLVEEPFEYQNLKISKNSVTYKNVVAKNIVFAEGFGVKKNPFFKSIPLNGTKGEVITIKAPKLRIEYAIKSSVFVIPIGNNNYTVGSTYNWSDKTNLPTDEGRAELVKKLKTFLKCDFKIVEHVAGIRPTTKDRRPLVGEHAKNKNLFVLNGLGTRGVMIAPYVANALYNYIENKIPLNKEISINRFDS